MKTPLTELIKRLEEKIKICSSNNLEREAMGMIEAKAIATELLEKEREQIEKAVKDTNELDVQKANVVWQSEPCGLLHSTDFSGKCFKCGEQVFVREEK